MIKVGVVGLGMMGNTHLDVYAKRGDVQVVALADADPKRLSGEERAAGNVEGQAQGSFDISTVKKYSDAAELINDPEVDVVDICLPTFLHRRFAVMALEAGKHVFLEKPVERHSADAFAIADAAEKSGKIAMPGMCMRFWPGWDWLKKAVDEGTYGRVLAANFRRLSSHPGGPFYLSGERSGGAALDLHIHDTDFIQYCFGVPTEVVSHGYSCLTDEPDHIFTRYKCGDIPLVTAEGAWCMAKGFPFTMTFEVNFEKATLRFDISDDDGPLTLFREGEDPEKVQLRDGMGYDYELAYFLECVGQGKQPEVVTMRDGARAVKIVEAERESMFAGGKPVSIG